MLGMFSRYLFCGWPQLRAGQKIKGLFLLLSFPLSVVFAAFYLYDVQAYRDIYVSLVAMAMSLLLWVYHVLEMRDLTKAQAAVSQEEFLDSEPQATSSRPRKLQGKKAVAAMDHLYSKGRIAFLRGSMDEAKECFEQLLNNDRWDSDAAFQLGRVHTQQGDSRQAERFFRQARQAPGGAKWSEEIKKYLAENKS
jgi:tetratricopeptide (TPR) repeat protein